MSKTLDSPSEVSKNGPFKSNIHEPQLSAEEFEQANKELNDQSFLKFKRVERIYADPRLDQQSFSLHSFVPAKGAVPDEQGVYGMIKFRGSFPTQEEANERAEWLIKNVDSYNSILTGYVGRPFPLTGNNREYCTEVNEVDLKKKTEEVVSSDLKEKRAEDKKIAQELKDKEKKLLDDVREDKPPEPKEDYTMLRVKRSQLIFTYNETMKKMKQMVKSLEAAEQEINEMDAEDPEYKQDYINRYMDARKEVGLENPEGFMKYLDKDETFKNLLDSFEDEESSS